MVDFSASDLAQAGYDEGIGLDVIPGVNPPEETQNEIKYNKTPLQESFLVGTRGTEYHKIYDRIISETVGQTPGVLDDPTFDAKKHPELIEGILEEHKGSILSSGSYEQAHFLKQEVLKSYEDSKVARYQGVGGQFVTAMATMLDLDVPLLFAMPESAPLKALSTAGKAGRIAAAATQGAMIVGGIEGAKVLTGPTGEWKDVISAGVQGAAMGATIGLVGGKTKNIDDDLYAAERTIHERNTPDGDLKAAGKMPEPNMTPRMNPEESIGAASLREEKFDPTLVDTSVVELRNDAQQFLREQRLDEKTTEFPNTPIGKAAESFHEAVGKTPLGGFFETMWNSDSTIAKSLAYKMAESSAGIVRNITTGAVMTEQYMTRLLAPIMEYETHLGTWIKGTQTGSKLPGFIQRFSPDIRDRFNREVFMESEARNATGKGIQGQHPSVTAVVDALAVNGDEALKVMKGLDGQVPVKGSETLTPKPGGHIPHHVNGHKILDFIHNKIVSKADIVAAFKAALRASNPSWSEEILDKMANAPVRRALTFASDTDANAYRMLTQEGVAYTHKYLMDSGLLKTEADAIIDGLRKVNPEAQKLGALRHRMEMDLTTPIPNSNLRLVDLMYTDVPEVMYRYSKSVAGASALARHNIQYADRADLINAIQSELAATKGAKPISSEDLNNFFSYFGGGPIAGGVTPWTRRLLSLTGLSIFGGLGFAQAGEFGAGVAAVGLQRYLKGVTDQLRKLAPQELNQVSHMIAAVKGEEKVLMEQFHFDMLQRDKGFWASAGKYIDAALATGRRAQGIITGFYWVRHFQQCIGIRSMLHALKDTSEGLNPLKPAKLADLGLEGKQADRIMKNFQTIVTRDANGIDLHPENWNPADFEAMGAVLNRHVNQVVQKAMAGEENPWIHKMVGAVMLQGKGFSLLAINKQTIRNMKLGNENAAMTFAWCLATATAAYTAQQMLAGNLDKLSPTDVIKGGISNSNMTAWMPQGWDPLMGLLGADSLKMSKFNMNARNDIVGTPPVFSTVNRLAHIPEAAFHVATPGVSYSASDINALQAAPILGNLAWLKGFSNALKDNATSETKPKD